MPSRIWILPISAVLIIALCVYKWTRQYDTPIDVSGNTQCSAHLLTFELSDQNNRRVRLERYLSRHQILLVFFDGPSGAEQDPVLQVLRKRYAELKQKGVIVLGISTAIPQHNRTQRRAGVPRAANQPKAEFPFELLSDVSIDSAVYRRWGRFDSSRQRPTTGTFLIDRAGRVQCRNGVPKPLPDPVQTINELLDG